MPDFMTKQFMDKYGRSGTCSDGVAMASWAHLNAGQRRMLLGNVLRGRIRRGGTVHIGEQEFKE